MGANGNLPDGVEERRSGRTTRGVLAAIGLAKEGKHVAFVVHTVSMLSIARRMVGELESTFTAVMEQDGSEIFTFSSSGYVKVVSCARIEREAQLKGRYDAIVIDHAVDRSLAINGMAPLIGRVQVPSADVSNRALSLDNPLGLDSKELEARAKRAMNALSDTSKH